ncbi:Ankyrin repeat-containing protein [Camellia lanceoleosa]|uniref:Ankyrin repeat-containing protein n=1 Tax=Camellia lanceoleosa TaxID=1840588 RepID=A0ACC0HE58_9ERIC|nr:Ankyrin repeat-containing protein [Camellia lanceoleosa]
MDSKLYNAAMGGNIDILKLHEEHVNFQLTPNKNTVLHIAALFGRTECVEEILKMNSSLLCQMNVKGDTALHLAAREGQEDSVDALIKGAKKLDVEDSVELESGSTMTKKMLRARNEDGDTALHDAVRLYSHGIILDRLLTEYPDTYTANNAGETPLYIAAERGQHQVVSQILKTCTAAAYDGPGGRTALHAVVISNDEEITKTLLDWNKDLAKEPDMYGWTPLHYAARFGHVERAKQLLDVDKSIAYVIANKDGKKTALHVAASQGHVGVMEVLRSQCPDCWEMVNDKGQNILHVAVQNENKKAVKFILKNSQLNSFINHKDTDGNTPLHLTATTFHANRLIYNKRADRMAFNKENQTPLDVTTHYENITSVFIKEELEAAGATLDSPLMGIKLSFRSLYSHLVFSDCNRSNGIVIHYRHICRITTFIKPCHFNLHYRLLLLRDLLLPIQRKLPQAI